MTKIENDQAEPGKIFDGKAPADEIPFGVMLKAAREQAGFTIERAAMATRIAQPFVEALEQGAFEKLPGAVFGRGFIRNLCKTYGKDSSEILLAFDQKTNAGKGKDISLSSRDEKRHQQLKKGVLLIQTNEWKGRIKALAPHHYLRAKPLVIIVTAVLCLIFLVNQFNQDEIGTVIQESAKIKDPSEAVSGASNAKEPATVEPSVSVTNTVQPTAPAQAAEPSVAASSVENIKSTERPDGLQDIELRVKDAVNVKITKDQEKQFGGQLQPETYRYRFKDQLKLYIEDMSVVEIYFNGQKVPSSAIKGESKRLTFQGGDGQIAKKASPQKL